MIHNLEYFLQNLGPDAGEWALFMIFGIFLLGFIGGAWEFLFWIGQGTTFRRLTNQLRTVQPSDLAIWIDQQVPKGMAGGFKFQVEPGLRESVSKERRG
jgi:hypothetical protein